MWGKFRPLTGILSKNTGPSRAIQASPVNLVFFLKGQDPACAGPLCVALADAGAQGAAAAAGATAPYVVYDFDSEFQLHDDRCRQSWGVNETLYRPSGTNMI